jgi:hypothetical protein
MIDRIFRGYLLLVIVWSEKKHMKRSTCIAAPGCNACAIGLLSGVRIGLGVILIAAIVISVFTQLG